MNERLKFLRKNLNLSQDAFAKRLGVTGAGISKIESGDRNLTEQMLISVCREFNVSEDWLRNGIGEMFVPLSRNELAARIVGNVLSTDDEFINNVFIALGQMSKEEWDVIKRFVDRIKGN